MADSSNPAPAVQAASSSSSTMTWRKISLPLPHLFPHLTINLRGHLPPARPSSPPPTGGAGSAAAAPVTKAKTGRDWKLRRQKTYDSPGCLNAAAAAGAPPLAGKPPPHRPASVANDSTANVPVSKGLETGHYEDNEKVQEEERETGTDGPRNLDSHEFKLLYAKTVSATPESHFRNPGSSKSKIQLELLDYTTMDLEVHVLWVEGIRQKIDSLAFWKNQRHRFPYLSKLAFTLLALQASSAPSEREFSIAGWHCAGRKNRTDKDNLAAKVFISCNKDILRPLLL